MTNPAPAPMPADGSRPAAKAQRRSTALLIPCPWSGDEYDPIPRTYRAWFWLYRTTRRMRHLIGLHDWPPAGLQTHCTWCGAPSKAASRGA